MPLNPKEAYKAARAGRRPSKAWSQIGNIGKTIASNWRNSPGFRRMGGVLGAGLAVYGAARVFMPSRSHTMGSDFTMSLAEQFTVGKDPSFMSNIRATSPASNFMSGVSKIADTPGVRGLAIASAVTMGLFTGGVSTRMARRMMVGSTMSKGRQMAVTAATAVGGGAAGMVYGTNKSVNVMGDYAKTTSAILRDTLGMRGVGRPNLRRMRVGSGSRTWTQPTLGRRMAPNPNAAGGDLVLAMHRTKHKSFI